MRDSAKAISDNLSTGSGASYIAAKTVSMAVAEPSSGSGSSEISVFGNATLESLSGSTNEAGNAARIFSVSYLILAV